MDFVCARILFQWEHIWAQLKAVYLYQKGPETERVWLLIRVNASFRPTHFICANTAGVISKFPWAVAGYFSNSDSIVCRLARFAFGILMHKFILCGFLLIIHRDPFIGWTIELWHVRCQAHPWMGPLFRITFVHGFRATNLKTSLNQSGMDLYSDQCITSLLLLSCTRRCIIAWLQMRCIVVSSFLVFSVAEL